MSEYTSEHAAWNGEARKHGLTYGQYVAQVERHGTLPPPPKNKKTRKTEPEETEITRECRECGITFNPGFTASGNPSLAKLCPICYRKSQLLNGQKRHNSSDTEICKICGKEFPKEKDTRGYNKTRGVCFECKPKRTPKTITDADLIGTCKSCGKEFKRTFTPSGAISARNFCNECHGKAYSRVLPPPTEIEYLKCLRCGDAFPQPYDKRNHRIPRLFCDQCLKDIRKQRRDDKRC